MLTQTDLSQIRGVVKEEVNGAIQSQVPGAKAIQSQVPGMMAKAIQSQVPGMMAKAIQSQVPSIVTGILQKGLKPIKKDLKKIRKDLEFAVGVLDRDRWKLEKRVDVIESHIGLSSAN
ncbi:MAG: hypothetical protein UX05_C0016G0009 [Candidatus Amesbacteria bacterium GW2011_GWC2_45_19]|uniref:Uncharacterized protein n=1 Tax=Candidatus Amesbacteria bacterium GW2011_GWC2_45_19 TaxID=1618366 RepID=A0A0G1P8X3_9BACT|nr:MAG: hypothetical protein UX05_C0016G0009 [Candidatus Amesbacteria bacterium GW2011_GWC2_45_19]